MLSTIRLQQDAFPNQTGHLFLCLVSLLCWDIISGLNITTCIIVIVHHHIYLFCGFFQGEDKFGSDAFRTDYIDVFVMGLDDFFCYRKA